MFLLVAACITLLTCTYLSHGKASTLLSHLLRRSDPKNSQNWALLEHPAYYYYITIIISQNWAVFFSILPVQPGLQYIQSIIFGQQNLLLKLLG